MSEPRKGIGAGSCWARDWKDEPRTGVSTTGDTAPGYNLAAAEIFELAARRLRANESLEGVARELMPAIKIMARLL